MSDLSDRTRVMRLKAPHDFPGLGEDAYVAIAATNEEVVRTGAYATQIIALAMSV